MHLKKVYLEITNRCNLNCDFCIKNQRKIKDISFDEFKRIVAKIKDYTDELYLHVLGEPLLHKDINKFIDYASDNGILVNITTNGYLIDKIKDNKNIHRLNVSIHSYNSKYKITLEDYLNNIFTVIDKLRSKTFVSLRIWFEGKNNQEMLKYINERYKSKIDKFTHDTVYIIAKNLVINSFHKFIWPDLNNNYYSEKGTCYGLINHIGILSDGTIIPCCLDSQGIINLGNIYKDDLADIFNSQRVKDMISGFKHNQKCEELCRHCKFLE